MFGQDGRVLACPEVVEMTPSVVFHPSRFDPAHLYRMDQFRHLGKGERGGERQVRERGRQTGERDR